MLLCQFFSFVFCRPDPWEWKFHKSSLCVEHNECVALLPRLQGSFNWPWSQIRVFGYAGTPWEISWVLEEMVWLLLQSSSRLCNCLFLLHSNKDYRFIFISRMYTCIFSEAKPKYLDSSILACTNTHLHYMLFLLACLKYILFTFLDHGVVICVWSGWGKGHDVFL